MSVKHNCYICGFNLCIERHHILPRAQGGTDDIANIIRLCPNCHTAVHKGIYTKEELFALKEAKEATRRSTPGRSIQPNLTLEESLFHSGLTPEEINVIVDHEKHSPGNRLL